MPKCDFKPKLQTNFILEITFQHGSSPVNLLHIFRTPFLKNICRRLLLRVRWFFNKGIFSNPLFKYEVEILFVCCTSFFRKV